MHRFFCPKSDLSSTSCKITEKKELHHLHDVLRLKKGDSLALFNGRGKEALGKIVNQNAHEVNIAIQSVHDIDLKSPIFTLACAIPQKSKFETIVEKSTELGVSEIIPMITQRTEFKNKMEIIERKLKRFQSVAINAAKQSQRSTVPQIHDIIKFESALEKILKDSITIIPSLSGKRKNLYHALNELNNPKKIAFLIGPEGDFTPEEYKIARKKGCIPITLGDQILKVETAAISALACANAFFAEKQSA